MPTKQQRREIYWTAYCCLDGEECIYTSAGLCWLLNHITNESLISYRMQELFPELWKLGHKLRDEYGLWAPRGSPGWPERKEILLRAIEMTY